MAAVPVETLQIELHGATHWTLMRGEALRTIAALVQQALSDCAASARTRE